MPLLNKDEITEKTKTYLKKFSDDYEFGYKGTHRSAHLLLWISFIFLIVGCFWAYFAILDEVTVAQGKVIPSKQIQLIQNLEGGIIKEILVHPGQVVQQNQIIAYLDNTRFKSEYNAAIEKENALKIKITRLNAEMAHQSLVIPPALQKADPSLIASETALYQSQNQQIQVLQGKRDLIVKEIKMTEPLAKVGDVSKVDLLHLQQEMDEIDNQILTLKTAELDELTKAKSDLNSLESDIQGIKDRYERTTVRSPVKGIINEVYLTTVGGVIKPGDNIMDIVPLDDTLLIEANVRPSDIGFIHQGQEATVKITAYDYSIYGGLVSTVEHISADTIKDEKNEPFYHIRVRTKQNYLKAKDGKLLYIIPGMTASVDILTGHKSVLDYLLKPILKARQDALRER